VRASPQQLQAFAEHLMPILAKVGVVPPEPEIYDSVIVSY
jgi:hypothetical protein